MIIYLKLEPTFHIAKLKIGSILKIGSLPPPPPEFNDWLMPKRGDMSISTILFCCNKLKG
ncbi:MAG: hypothetical protein LBF13_01390 [Campylobacteraceae bacterium]|jgi:hypothetical protein|nr:hypothetical protein [Campylobacteraceae bacterium]